MLKKLLMALMLVFCLITNASAGSDGKKEIVKLRKEVVRLAKSYKDTQKSVRLSNKNKLARYQAKFLIKVFSYEIYMKIKRMGVTRKMSDIEKMVEAAYLCSWVFTDLGENHLERMVLILQWAKDESLYDKKLVKFWKKGTYLKSIDKRVLKDTTDYGAWQINEEHRDNIKILNFLYDSGIINFKIKNIRGLDDVLDTNTNAAARCLIETDRKSRGWEWKHIRDHKFNKFLRSIFKKLERDKLYSRKFAERYYNIVPVKHYKNKRLFSY